MARLAQIAVAASDPDALAGFWSAVLGWERAQAKEPGSAALAAPDGATPVVFLKRPKTATIEVPLHLDVNVSDRASEVERVLGLGGKVVLTKAESVGEISQEFTVMRDPEGNGFCVQAPPGTERAAVGNVTFACREPRALAEFWAEALAYDPEPFDPGFAQKLLEGGLDPAELDGFAAVRSPDNVRPRLLFQRREKTEAPEPPLHLDLEADDVDAELERLASLGAAVAGEGHGYGWSGMRDPEGNAFCLGPAGPGN